jgi:hypothetical protein
MSSGTVAWSVESETLTRLGPANIEAEKRLENWILGHPDAIGATLRIVASQLDCDGKPLDILALDKDGSLVVIELKKGDVYREALAQVVDYASWIAGRTRDALAAAVDARLKEAGAFEKILSEHLDAELSEDWDPRDIDVRLVVAGMGADDRLRRMITYLSSRGVVINGVFFDAYDVNGKVVLVRTAVLTDEQEQTPRRYQKGSNDALIARAKDAGSEAYVQPLRAAWEGISALQPRVAYWALSAKKDNRGVVARLYPGKSQEKAGWLQVVVARLADDVGRDETEVTKEFAGLITEDSWIKIVSADVANKVVAVLKKLYV